MIIDTENIQIRWEEHKLDDDDRNYIYKYTTQYFPNFGYGKIMYDGYHDVYWVKTDGYNYTQLFDTKECEDISLEEKKELIKKHLQKRIEANFGESKC